MKNIFKILGIAALISVIGFGLISCGGDDEEGDTDLAGNIRISGSAGGSAITSAAKGATLHAVYTGTESGITYQWKRGSANLGTGTSQAASDDGNYTVTVSATGFNSKTSAMVTVGVPFVAVTDITGVPTTATAGTPLSLTGTVAPESATNKTITWTVKNAGTTGAAISGSTLNATAAGTVTVTATVANGATATTPFTKDFTISVNAGSPATFTVTFVVNGGSNVANITNVASGAKINKPADPTKAGSTFGGWYKEAALTNAWNFNIDTVTASISLYAKWTVAPALPSDLQNNASSLWTFLENNLFLYTSDADHSSLIDGFFGFKTYSTGSQRMAEIYWTGQTVTTAAAKRTILQKTKWVKETDSIYNAWPNSKGYYEYSFDLYGAPPLLIYELEFYPVDYETMPAGTMVLKIVKLQ